MEFVENLAICHAYMLNIFAGFGGIGTCLLRFVPRTYLFTCYDMAKCISWNVHNSHHTQDFVEQS